MRFARMKHSNVKGDALLPVTSFWLNSGWKPVDAAQVVPTEEQTVAEVLAEVGDDPVKAAAALKAEQASESPRSTLVERLSRIADQS